MQPQQQFFFTNIFSLETSQSIFHSNTMHFVYSVYIWSNQINPDKDSTGSKYRCTVIVGCCFLCVSFCCFRCVFACVTLLKLETQAEVSNARLRRGVISVKASPLLVLIQVQYAGGQSAKANKSKKGKVRESKTS